MKIDIDEKIYFALLQKASRLRVSPEHLANVAIDDFLKGRLESAEHDAKAAKDRAYRAESQRAWGTVYGDT